MTLVLLMSLLLITSVYDQTHYGWKCHWNFRKGMLYFSFVKFITFNKWLLLCTRIKIGNVILHIVMRVDIFHHMSSQLPSPPQPFNIGLLIDCSHLRLGSASGQIQGSQSQHWRQAAVQPQPLNYTPWYVLANLFVV